MRFFLVDKILSVEPVRLVAMKQVTSAEEYLADHFPTFPVLPGVLMLEALTQACIWLMHQQRDFACSIGVLREARNVRYGHFVAPGRALELVVEHSKDTEAGATFKAAGNLDGQLAVSGKLEIAYFNLADHNAELAGRDAEIQAMNRQRWAILRGDAEVAL